MVGRAGLGLQPCPDFLPPSRSCSIHVTLRSLPIEKVNFTGASPPRARHGLPDTDSFRTLGYDTSFFHPLHTSIIHDFTRLYLGGSEGRQFPHEHGPLFSLRAQREFGRKPVKPSTGAFFFRCQHKLTPFNPSTFAISRIHDNGTWSTKFWPFRNSRTIMVLFPHEDRSQ